MTSPDEYLYELENGLRFWCRRGTNDQNTTYACAYEDEYGLAAEDVRGKLVLDAGAYTGGVGVWLASRGALVVCVEPVPDNAELVRRNAVVNGVEKAVSVLEAAFGYGETQVVRYAFEADPEWNGRGHPFVHTNAIRESIHHHGYVGTTHRDAPVDQSYREAVVPTVTLTGISSRYGIPDLVKVDCEGGEWALLDDPLVAEVPLIVGEWHPWDTVHGEAGVGAFRGQHRDGGLTQESLHAMLCDSHRVEFTGPVLGPGGFRATRR